MSLVSSRPAHRPICLSCLVLSLWSTFSETLDKTLKRPFSTTSTHKKKTKHADTSTALDRSQAADKEEGEAGPASHRTSENLNMRQNVLDMSGFTLIQCTHQDEGCATDASLQVPTHAAAGSNRSRVSTPRITFCSSRRRKGEITNRS